MPKTKNTYSFEVFKALVELEIRRIERYKKEKNFSIAFLYAPNLAKSVKYFKDIDKSVEISFLIRSGIRSTDVVSEVEDDFVFLFLPETSKIEAKKVIERIKKALPELDIIEGIATYPDDGTTEYELFNTLVKIMNEKLIPVIELYSEEEKNSKS